jgi:predicted negative regulator of RcsB-dependent stress response
MKVILKRLLPFLFLLLMAGCAALPPTVSRNSAVISLWDNAQSEAAHGNLDRASASLERALRIEPLNPVLWQKLALVRLDQGLSRQAENLARKSNSLAEGDRRLRRKNWTIIGEARAQSGDEQGAATAFERAKNE